MKAFISLLLLMAISLNIIAQETDENKKRKNEIGLTLLRTLSLKSSYGYNTKYSSTPYFSFLNGISYKRIIGKNAIRIGADYRERNDKGTGDFIGTSSYREIRYRMGYQRTIGDKVINPYFAVDLTIIDSKFQNEFSGGFIPSYLKEDLKYFGFGIAPTIGLKIKLFKTLSLSAETNLELLWINKKGSQVKNSSDDISSRITNPINATEFLKRINPLNTFSLNYSF
jgi:hypothetical protein